MADVVQSASGTSMIQFRDAVARIWGDDVVAKGLAQMATNERELLQTMTTLDWIPVTTLANAVDAWAYEAGITPEELTVRGVRESTKESFATVWRVLLRFTSDDALIARAPLLYSRVRNAGTLRVEHKSAREGRLTLSGWKNPTDRQLLSLATAFETVLELTGRPHARCPFKRTHDGGTFVLTWGDASIPERRFPSPQKR